MDIRLDDTHCTSCPVLGLSRKQKTEIIEATIRQYPADSARGIARRLNWMAVDDKTIGSIRRRLESGAEIPHLEKIVGSDGKSYPSKSAAYWARTTTVEREPTTHYATPSQATEALLEREHFDGSILEPACGEGAIADVLRAHGYRVTATDIRGGHDFLKRSRPCENILTNPPYHDTLASDFAAHALRLARRKVAFLVPMYFLEGVQRNELFTGYPLKAVYVFSRRLTFNLNDKVPFGVIWIVWDREYTGEPNIGWIL